VTAGEERLTPGNRDAEEVYLGLRTRNGLEVDETELDTVTRWIEAGWANLDDRVLRLTPNGWLRLDSLAADLVALRTRRPHEVLGATPSHCYI
jgi:coproporphyrinogen III oxidase-like Fe-S oxidoreductase